jgi:hypothetical protein
VKASRARRWARLVVAIGAGLLGSACGIAAGAPKAVSSGQVPAQIVSPTLPVGTPTTLTGGVLYNIYLINPSGMLQGYERNVSLKGGLSDVLGFLIDGPAQLESQEGVTTAIAPNTQILNVTLPPKNPTPATNLVTVNFNSVFAPVAASVQAVEQVVYTIDEALTPAPSILFEITGAPIEIPQANGAFTAGPVTIANYPGVLAN